MVTLTAPPLPPAPPFPPTLTDTRIFVGAANDVRHGQCISPGPSSAADGLREDCEGRIIALGRHTRIIVNSDRSPVAAAAAGAAHGKGNSGRRRRGRGGEAYRDRRGVAAVAAATPDGGGIDAG